MVWRAWVELWHLSWFCSFQWSMTNICRNRESSYTVYLFVHLPYYYPLCQTTVPDYQAEITWVSCYQSHGCQSFNRRPLLHNHPFDLYVARTLQESPILQVLQYWATSFIFWLHRLTAMPLVLQLVSYAEHDTLMGNNSACLFWLSVSKNMWPRIAQR